MVSIQPGTEDSITTASSVKSQERSFDGRQSSMDDESSAATLDYDILVAKYGFGSGIRMYEKSLAAAQKQKSLKHDKSNGIELASVAEDSSVDAVDKDGESRDVPDEGSVSTSNTSGGIKKVFSLLRKDITLSKTMSDPVVTRPTRFFKTPLSPIVSADPSILSATSNISKASIFKSHSLMSSASNVSKAKSLKAPSIISETVNVSENSPSLDKSSLEVPRKAIESGTSSNSISSKAFTVVDSPCSKQDSSPVTAVAATIITEASNTIKDISVSPSFTTEVTDFSKDLIYAPHIYKAASKDLSAAPTMTTAITSATKDIITRPIEYSVSNDISAAASMKTTPTVATTATKDLISPPRARRDFMKMTEETLEYEPVQNHISEELTTPNEATKMAEKKVNKDDASQPTITKKETSHINLGNIEKEIENDVNCAEGGTEAQISNEGSVFDGNNGDGAKVVLVNGLFIQEGNHIGYIPGLEDQPCCSPEEVFTKFFTAAEDMVNAGPENLLPFDEAEEEEPNVPAKKWWFW